MARLARVILLVLAAAPLLAQQPAPTIGMPGAADRPLDPMSLLGRSQRDVRIEDAQAGLTVYHGMPLLEVLERSGLDIRTMAGERKAAAAGVAVATSRDGYTVAFSIGELLMHRRDPRVFLVSETSTGPLPENEGPVRLIVHGDRVRHRL